MSRLPPTSSALTMTLTFTWRAIDAFMAAVFPRNSLQVADEWLGLLLVPNTTFQRSLLLVGAGENGKSVYLSLATALIGRDNISTRTLHELAENRFAAPDLFGKLANISADISATELREVDLFKRLTGEDRITAERKYSPAFDFTPYARLLFSGQEVPRHPMRRTPTSGAGWCSDSPTCSTHSPVRRVVRRTSVTRGCWSA